MVATTLTVFDGQIYQIGQTIPDLGSLECVEHIGNRRFYEGYASDSTKLPKYNNLATGSSATLVGDNGLEIYKYVSSNKTWTKIN